MQTYIKFPRAANFWDYFFKKLTKSPEAITQLNIVFARTHVMFFIMFYLSSITLGNLSLCVSIVYVGDRYLLSHIIYHLFDFILHTNTLFSHEKTLEEFANVDIFLYFCNHNHMKKTQ